MKNYFIFKKFFIISFLLIMFGLAGNVKAISMNEINSQLIKNPDINSILTIDKSGHYHLFNSPLILFLIIEIIIINIFGILIFIKFYNK